MYRLLGISGSPAREILLEPGTHSLGRNPGNGLCIDDPSVSSSHCVIVIDQASMRIRDLGSTNGTYVDGRRIDETLIDVGQHIRLGTVEFLLQSETSESSGLNPRDLAPGSPPACSASDSSRLTTRRLFTSAGPARIVHPASHTAAPSTPASPNPPPKTAIGTAEPDKPAFCKNHYQNLARYLCPKCQRPLCDLCVNTRGSAGGGLKFCKICGLECQLLALKPIATPTAFFPTVRKAYSYPFRGDGWLLLFGGTFFFGFLDLANYIGRHSFMYGMRAMMMRVVIFTFILGAGYLFSYLKNIIACTAQGDERMPDWPELNEWKEDIVSPMFQLVMISLISFGPALVTWLAMDWWFEVDYPWLVWLVALAGCLYFPMAFLGVAMFDSLAAVHPMFVLSSIATVPREYTVAALVFGGILAFRWLAESLLTMLLHLPVAPTIASDLLGICLLLIEARILGLLYLTQKQRLGWFKNAR